MAYRNSEKEQVFNRSIGDFQLFIYYKLVLKTANIKTKRIVGFFEKNVYDRIYYRFYQLLKNEKNNLENQLEPNTHYQTHIENILENLEYQSYRSKLNKNHIKIARIEKYFNKLFNSKYNFYENEHKSPPKYNPSELYIKTLRNIYKEVNSVLNNNYLGIAVAITISIIFFIVSIFVGSSDEYNFLDIYSFIGTTVTLMAIILYFWDKRLK